MKNVQGYEKCCKKCYEKRSGFKSVTKTAVLLFVTFDAINISENG